MLLDPDDAEKAALCKWAAIFVLTAAGGLLICCGLKVPGTGGLADRCADITEAAMPSAEIDIEKRTSESTGLSKIVARVEGTRTDLPADSPLPHDLAAECEFDSTTLTAFRWTKGGPRQYP